MGTAIHHCSPCTEQPGKPQHLNLSSECLVCSRDLTLRCLPEPSREHKWVKSGRWELSWVRRACPAERMDSYSDRYVQHRAAVWERGPRVTLNISGLVKKSWKSRLLCIIPAFKCCQKMQKFIKHHGRHTNHPRGLYLAPRPQGCNLWSQGR